MLWRLGLETLSPGVFRPKAEDRRSDAKGAFPDQKIQIIHKPRDEGRPSIDQPRGSWALWATWRTVKKVVSAFVTST